jgi:hypothetical protein
MNFLIEPPHSITPNTDMDGEQTVIAGQFVDELIDLGVLLEATAEDPLEATAPLFCLPKPGQPGEWRVLADMRRGGQNECIGNDPTIFPKSGHILRSMYSGGYSAVVDASKFFYQFTTRPKERKYMGVVHPITGKHYYYAGLPMGSANSPSLAGRYGTAFLRLLRARSQLFQGKPSNNTWWSSFAQGEPLDPAIGQGYTLKGMDGLHAALLWAHCDDFLIHAPTKAKCIAALRAFLDMTVDLGLLCHPGKLSPPAQIVKYTGFLFDTRDQPALRIPSCKREKGIAMIDFVLSKKGTISRLVLAVLAGVLESVVEATPSRLGHTYLRSLVDNIHLPDWDGLPYYSEATLTETDREGLLWWRLALLTDASRHCRLAEAGTLIPTWGDGSGTGTGGTYQLPNSDLDMWMGVWAPQVFHFSSNWKELRTLLATLERAKKKRKQVKGATFFYFTDNIVTYYIVSSGASPSPLLHRLIVEIKTLELELDCQIEVVHVPGTSMIVQGTDGLSRGVWVTPLHDPINQNRLLAEVFAPIPFSPSLGSWMINNLYLHPSTPWIYGDWSGEWCPADVLDKLTLWAPPPEVAAQLIFFLLQCWTEKPLTTSFAMLVPRVLQKHWHRVSRHVLDYGVFSRDVIPAPWTNQLLKIPSCLLYVPSHVRSLPPIRMDTIALSSQQRHHEQQAAFMRGLSNAPLEGFTPAPV